MKRKIRDKMVKKNERDNKANVAIESFQKETSKMLRKQYSHNWWAWRGTGRKFEMDYK